MIKDKKINVIAEKGATQITILEGIAIPPKEKKIQYLTGTIDAPKRYAEKRTVDPKKALVIIDDNNAASTITLICDQGGEESSSNPGQYSDTIVGKVELHTTLSALPINNAKNFSIDEFRTWVRQNAQIFATFDEHANLTSNLSKVKGVIVTTLENEKDTKGNAKRLLENTFNSELKKEFHVSVPLLKGGLKRAFRVDICLSVEGNGVVLWLESNDLKKILAEDVESQITEQKNYFEGKNYCVIYEAK